MHYPDFIPVAFQSVIERNRGRAGLEWYDTLPHLLEDACRKWHLTPIKAFSNLSYNYVCLVQQQNANNAVLKIGFHDKEFITEATALEVFGGSVSPQVLELDEPNFLLLMEAVEPAQPLHSLGNDTEETQIAANIMKQLWKPVPTSHPFPTTADWGRGFQRLRDTYGGSGPLPKELLDQAESIFQQLHRNPHQPVVLHGDLHHDNILSSSRAPWLIIDPKGVIGEPEYEVGAFIRNPAQRLRNTEHLKSFLETRLDIFAQELKLERDRIKKWAFAQAILSAWWSIEGQAEPNEGFNQYVRIAHALRTE